jgi:hypothetical protein
MSEYLVDIGAELKEHYEKVLLARDEILGSPNSEAREKASIITATTATIKELAKLQTDLYDSSMVAALQAAIYQTFEEQVPELKDKFLTKLEEILAQDTQ